MANIYAKAMGDNMKNLIKTNREINCTANMMRALLDGCVLVSGIGSLMELIDGKLVLNGNVSSESNYIKVSEYAVQNWTAYKRAEWYENIQEGVICFVSDTLCRSSEDIVVLITSCDAGVFRAKSGSAWAWKYATPLTKEELLARCAETQQE